MNENATTEPAYTNGSIQYPDARQAYPERTQARLETIEMQIAALRNEIKLIKAWINALTDGAGRRNERLDAIEAQIENWSAGK